MSRRPSPKAKEGKPKKALSPLARRRLQVQREMRERASVLRELSYFGTSLCECGHFKEVHRRRKDGSVVCRECRLEERRVHPFRSQLQEAREYFAGLPEPDLSIALDAAGSGVVEYDTTAPDAAGTIQGDDDMPPTTKTRVRRPAPGRTPAEAPRPPRPARRAEPAADGHACLCGCGEVAKSRFRPGHDAKLKSALTKQALEGGTAKERALAEKRMVKLGWGELLEKSRKSRAAKAARPKAAPGARTERQKAATAKMRAASAKSKVAEPDEDEVDDEQDFVEEDELEDDEDELEDDEDEDE